MQILNTTIQNRSKQQRLSSAHIVPMHHVDDNRVVDFLQSLDLFQAPKEQLLFSIGHALLIGNTNPAVIRFLKAYDFNVVKVEHIPKASFDLLGSVYQYLNSKRENLENGSFYTGKTIAKDMLSDLSFDCGEIIFDPSCGSGAFLFHSEAPPGQIYGVDSDPTAVMIAKFNYFIKFPDAPDPNLFHEDFFSWFASNSDMKFDYIIGNPPYGAGLDKSKIPSRWIDSGESFSYFTELGFSLLKPKGFLRYLVPEALLNVKRHTDVRLFILNKTNLRRIKKYSSGFSGVMSDVYMIELNTASDDFTLFEDTATARIPRKIFWDLKNNIFANLSSDDLEIIDKSNSLKKYDLSASIFALGVVTGDNKTMLLQKPIPGSEHIYTGKDVHKYRLGAPKNYLFFDRNRLQQVAPEYIYRFSDKLVYKTISKALRFALDSSGSLTSNSANLLIPQLPGYDIVSVLALLNSDLYSFLHIKLFGGVNKVGKENLVALPFPELTAVQNTTLQRLTRDVFISGDDLELQAYINFEIFGLTELEVEHINSELLRCLSAKNPGARKSLTSASD